MDIREGVLLEAQLGSVVLKVMGAKDFTLEVTGRDEITPPDFLRVHVRDGGLLERSGLHPTM